MVSLLRSDTTLPSLRAPRRNARTISRCRRRKCATIASLVHPPARGGSPSASAALGRSGQSRASLERRGWSRSTAPNAAHPGRPECTESVSASRERFVRSAVPSAMSPRSPMPESVRRVREVLMVRLCATATPPSAPIPVPATLRSRSVVLARSAWPRACPPSAPRNVFSMWSCVSVVLTRRASPSACPTSSNAAGPASFPMLLLPRSRHVSA
mmetsp:Transcript_40598/g.99715  ORF Transcript_40598/g.99715 Transcript_40598/m.99715 type:complete len:213 (-) Transcript_40598:877-1515(-)